MNAETKPKSTVKPQTWEETEQDGQISYLGAFQAKAEQNVREAARAKLHRLQMEKDEIISRLQSAPPVEQSNLKARLSEIELQMSACEMEIDGPSIDLGF